MIPSNNLATTIDEVIEKLESIITNAKKEQDPLGYFAALYQKVTKAVKEGIVNNEFDNGARMEKLDVIFANRYLAAYYACKSGQTVTASWQQAFGLAKSYWPIVLQHLLIGMNAHINLDLGIAAAEVSKGEDIKNLEHDFNKINQVLSSLVAEVQDELAQIWPMLKKILKLTGKADDFLVDFSMKLARDGAWKFATNMAAKPDVEWTTLIVARDAKIAAKARIITNPGWIINLIFGIVRLGERGTVAEKIEKLQ